MSYAIRYRQSFYGVGVERWKLYDQFDQDRSEIIDKWPTRETATDAIPSPARLSHNAYSIEHQVIVHGSRDYRRASRRSA